MIWTIPIGGKGTRTKALGEFKPFIEILGHKMLVWTLFSIKDKVSPQDTFIFTTTNYFRKKYNLEIEIPNILSLLNLGGDFEIFSSPDTVPGTSCSIYLAKNKLTTKEPVLVLNCDQYIDFELPQNINPKTGYVVLFADFGDKCGYAEITNGEITNFVEKNNLSSLASAGVFIVSEGKSLVWAIEKQLSEKHTTNGEFCVTPTLNYLIKKGHSIYPLSAKSYYDIGSLPGINYFIQTPLAKHIAPSLDFLEKREGTLKKLNPDKISSYSLLTISSF